MTERLKQFASQLTGSKSPIDQMYGAPHSIVYVCPATSNKSIAHQRTQMMSLSRSQSEHRSPRVARVVSRTRHLMAS